MNRINFTRLSSLALIIFAMFSTGCYYDQVLPSGPDPGKDVSYATDIQSIFDANCISCHGGSIAPNLSSGVSYNNLSSGGYINTTDPSSSLIYTKIAPGGSMESHAGPGDAATVLLWIEQGAKDN